MAHFSEPSEPRSAPRSSREVASSTCGSAQSPPRWARSMRGTLVVGGRSCASVFVRCQTEPQSSGGARMTKECDLSGRCALPIERIDCALRAVDSAAG
jgi:hypothetical protein